MPAVSVAKRFEQWPVDRLQPYARNARTHSEAQVAKIAASITEFGFTNPILVDSSDGIIAGHGRLLAAQLLGMAEVPVLVLDHLTDAQRRAYILADNRLALDAGWDEALLAEELAALQGEGFDLDLTGFEEDELDQQLADMEGGADAAEGGAGEDFEDPAPGAEAVSKRGDVWTIGQHRVMCGDSTLLADVQTLMAGDLADLLLTDPPYNVAYEGKTEDHLTIQNDSMGDDQFRAFLKAALGAAEGGNFRGGCRDVGWKVRQCLAWNKNTLVMGRQDYHWKHEPCLYGWKEGAAHTWEADRKQVTVLDFARPSRSEDHPTMKPVDLFEYQIRNSTKRGECVLDLFGGSGTAGVAAHKAGRRARLMEIDPRYCDVIVRRLQEATGLTAGLKRGGARMAPPAANDDWFGAAADVA